MILNPIHPGAATAVRELEALGEVRTYLITLEPPGSEQVVQALSGGIDSMVVAGGDGTQRLVTGVLAGTGVPLGILAMGTTYVYSRSPGLPHDSTGAALVMTGVPRFVDLERASLDGGSPEPFLAATDMGWDAEALLEVWNDLKK